MLRIKRLIFKESTDDGDTVSGVYDSALQSTRKLLFRTMFAIALAGKIKAKDVAKYFSTEHTDKYSIDLYNELNKLVDKQKKSTTKKNTTDS